MRRTLRNLFVLLAVLTAQLSVSARAALAGEADGSVCQLNAQSGLFGGGYGVLIDGNCVRVTADGSPPTPLLEYRVVSCGPTGHVVLHGATGPELCPAPVPRCQLLADGGLPGDAVWAYLVQYRTGTNPWLDADYWCPHAVLAQDAPDAATLRDQAIRLLPPVPIATTDDHLTLVNLHTIYWADTPTTRDLGPVTITGHTIHLRITFATATWNYGDDHTDTTTTPGTPYNPHHPCTTTTCPDHHGHTYRTPGTRTTTLHITWHATWSPDGTTYHPIGTTPLTGPEATYTLTVTQATTTLTR